ncbi:hypothetical protein RAS1_32870 [Phycisphaerae bacterium RAS1]|nr:hypothetical protein RAS1_32870 [Phycisphaerae bacterium RAS1]
MADLRKSVLLRIPADLWESLSRWARDDLRSINAQIEWALREAVRRHRGEQVAPPAEDARVRRSPGSGEPREGGTKSGEGGADGAKGPGTKGPGAIEPGAKGPAADDDAPRGESGGGGGGGSAPGGADEGGGKERPWKQLPGMDKDGYPVNPGWVIEWEQPPPEPDKGEQRDEKRRRGTFDDW